MQEDLIEKIGKSSIQHGKYNDRIYLMKFDEQDIDQILLNFNNLIKKNKYSKIFIKIAKNHEHLFLKEGFVNEASIPNFFNNEDCIFMGKFINKERKNISLKNKKIMEEVLSIATKKTNNDNKLDLPENYSIKILSAQDAKNLTLLYKKVFDSYPFPIFKPEYIKKTMRNNIVYFGCFFKNKLIAASSSEIDFESSSVEMTDFATYPDFRGQNIALILLSKMELEMKKEKIKTAYTIARSLSFGMNITFSKYDYRYGGTLINNTNISGDIESMNIWYKSIL